MRSVYPRLRGERLDPLASPVAVDGLSPASRGTLHHNDQDSRPTRFIPGFAGNAV